MLPTLCQNDATMVPGSAANSKNTMKNECRNRYTNVLLLKRYQKSNKWAHGAILCRIRVKERSSSGGSQLPTAMYPLRASENRVPCKGQGAYGNLQWLCRFGCQKKTKFLRQIMKQLYVLLYFRRKCRKDTKDDAR